MSHVRVVDSRVCAAGTRCTADVKSWASRGVGDIVVDSTADEACWPQRQDDVRTKPSKKKRRKSFLKTANGGEMGHFGEKEVAVQNGTQDDLVGLKFELTHVSKALLAVWRCAEKGNAVMFEPERCQNYGRSQLRTFTICRQGRKP